MVLSCEPCDWLCSLSCETGIHRQHRNVSSDPGLTLVHSVCMHAAVYDLGHVDDDIKRILNIAIVIATNPLRSHIRLQRASETPKENELVQSWREFTQLSLSGIRYRRVAMTVHTTIRLCQYVTQSAHVAIPCSPFDHLRALRCRSN